MGRAATASGATPGRDVCGRRTVVGALQAVTESAVPRRVSSGQGAHWGCAVTSDSVALRLHSLCAHTPPHPPVGRTLGASSSGCRLCARVKHTTTLATPPARDAVPAGLTERTERPERPE
jgi:hypothetical protein